MEISSALSVKTAGNKLVLLDHDSKCTILISNPTTTWASTVTNPGKVAILYFLTTTSELLLAKFPISTPSCDLAGAKNYLIPLIVGAMREATDKGIPLSALKHDEDLLRVVNASKYEELATNGALLNRYCPGGIPSSALVCGSDSELLELIKTFKYVLSGCSNEK
jgi:hypothetical protein